MNPQHPDEHDPPTRPPAPLAPELRHAAVARLLGRGNRLPPETVDRFIRQGPDLGINLDLIAVTPADASPETVSEVCLPVLGAGRTVMLFVSGSRASTGNSQNADRAAAIRQAVRLAARHRPVHLVQALIEPKEDWAARAFLDAGLRRLAELLYLSRPLRFGEAVKGLITDDAVARPGANPWPGGISVRPLRPGPTDDQPLADALQASYQDTLDCPELAGMRDTDDIIAAHRAVGQYDPALWWLVERDDRPAGCVLLNRCPAHQAADPCVELVYIGLSPTVRGLGLGEALLRTAIAAAANLERELRCAVDVRNTPARRVYERLGFRETGRRVAFVALARDLV